MDLDSELGRLRREVDALKAALPPPPATDTSSADARMTRLEERIATIGSVVNVLVTRLDALEAAHEEKVAEAAVLQNDDMPILHTGVTDDSPHHISHPRVHKKKKQD